MKKLGYAHYIRTDEKVQVNWYRKGKLGITFLDSSKHLFGKVVEPSELEFRYDNIEEQEAKDDVSKEEPQDLKERLKKLRRDRRSTSSQRAQKSSSKKKKKNKGDLLDDLKSVDEDLLKEVLGDE